MGIKKGEIKNLACDMPNVMLLAALLPSLVVSLAIICAWGPSKLHIFRRPLQIENREARGNSDVV